MATPVLRVGSAVIVRSHGQRAHGTAQRHHLDRDGGHDHDEARRILRDRAITRRHHGRHDVTSESFSTFVISITLSATSLISSTCEITMMLLK